MNKIIAFLNAAIEVWIEARTAYLKAKNQRYVIR
jgi:hypothetical protein